MEAQPFPTRLCLTVRKRESTAINELFF